ncbi:MAG: alpha/beta hydrolase [Mariprofundus sp.]|nr:alpha/beta hydrolase [Mariprofundus sp.]
MPRIEKITFRNSQGEHLSARLDLPDGDVQSYVLLVHCFTCNKSLRAAGYIAKALVEQGVAVFRFDFTGLGDSGGDFSETNFTSNVQDIFSAAAFMEASGFAAQILVGHSLGGTAVLKAARHIESVQAVVTIASPLSPAHVADQFAQSKALIAESGQAHVQLAGRDFIIKQQFIDDLEQASVAEDIAGLNKALLVMHAARDDTVAIANAAQIFQLAHHPKSYISLDQADHLMSAPADATYVGQMIAVWARRYVDSL